VARLALERGTYRIVGRRHVDTHVELSWELTLTVDIDEVDGMVRKACQGTTGPPPVNALMLAWPCMVSSGSP
jgi:hypothetical protein